MHELSVAHALTGAVEEALPAGAGPVREVHVRVGVLSGVVAQALEFAYEIAVADTRLEGSDLVVEVVPLSIHCATCDAIRVLPGTTSFRCPSCGTPSGDIRGGREVELVRVVLEDLTEAAS